MVKICNTQFSKYLIQNYLIVGKHEKYDLLFSSVSINYKSNDGQSKMEQIIYKDLAVDFTSKGRDLVLTLHGKGHLDSVDTSWRPWL